jgi:hypothetical protein
VGRELPQGLIFKIAQLWGPNLIHNSECAPGIARVPVSMSAIICASGENTNGFLRYYVLAERHPPVGALASLPEQSGALTS